MAYTINLTDGTVFATIPDGTTNTSSSLTLVGKNYAGYGEFLDENFIQHLENFSSTSSGGNPTVAQLNSPLVGQLWWDKTNTLLKVYSGSGGWKTISSATSSASQPSPSVIGDLWYSTTNQQLNVCTVGGNPGTFIVVGPGFSSAQGQSGAIPETIQDSVGATKYITSLYVSDTLVGIVYNSSQFTPSAPVIAKGFTTIYPGVTLSSNVAGAVFAGSATNAQLLDSLDSSQFVRADTNTATTGILRVQNNTGLFVGAANVFNVNTTTTDANIKSNISGGNLIIQANVSGTTFNVATALGSNGTFAMSNAATVGTTLALTGNSSGRNLTTAGNVSATGNITGGNVITAGLVRGATLSATANVQAGNVNTTGLISVTGNVTSQANIAGTYFLGNGALLTGVSAAVSVTKFVNGTSEGNIGATDGNINFNVAGTSNVLVLTTGTAFFTGNVSTIGIEKTGTNAIGNIGSAANYFNRVFATATTALYADVAERFAADELLEPGTVVELGGEKEITRSTEDLSENVFGVISTRPAYTMNGGAGEDDTHPAVAMTGRVPVKCVGTIRKGDRLVSAGEGVARAAQPGEATAFNVIGRSLENKHTPELGTIEAIVTIK
jgi:hypothetical protein